MDQTVPSPRRALVVDLALLLLLAALWGASYGFIKVGVRTIPPVTFIAGRTLVAGIVLLAVASARGVKMPRGRAMWGQFLIQACFNSVVPFTLIAWAERSVDSALATILNSTTPILAFLLTVAVTRHEAVTPRKVAGVLFGLAGIVLVIGVDALSSLGAALVPQAAIVVASVFYAGGAVFGRGFRQLDPIVPAAGSMLCGAALLIPASVILDHPWTVAPSAASLVALIGLSVFSTALAFVIYFHLIGRLGSLATTAQSYLRVPIGVGIGVVLLDETLAPTAIAGLVCVVAGVVAMTLPDRRQVEVTGR